MHFKDAVVVFIVVPILAVVAYGGYLILSAPDPGDTEKAPPALTVEETARVAMGIAPQPTPVIVPSLSSLLSAIAESHALGDVETAAVVITAVDAQIRQDLGAEALEGSARLAMERLVGLAKNRRDLYEMEGVEVRRLIGSVHGGLAQYFAKRAAGRSTTELSVRDADLRAAAHHLRRSTEYRSGDVAAEVGAEVRTQLDELMSSAGVVAGEAATHGATLLGRIERDLRQLEAALEDRLGVERQQ